MPAENTVGDFGDKFLCSHRGILVTLRVRTRERNYSYLEASGVLSRYPSRWENAGKGSVQFGNEPAALVRAPIIRHRKVLTI
jgi:hypothetical protein